NVGLAPDEGERGRDDRAPQQRRAAPRRKPRPGIRSWRSQRPRPAREARELEILAARARPAPLARRPRSLPTGGRSRISMTPASVVSPDRTPQTGSRVTFNRLVITAHEKDFTIRRFGTGDGIVTGRAGVDAVRLLGAGLKVEEVAARLAGQTGSP